MPASRAAWMVAMLSDFVAGAVHSRHGHAAERDAGNFRPVLPELNLLDFHELRHKYSEDT